MKFLFQAVCGLGLSFGQAPLMAQAPSGEGAYPGALLGSMKLGNVLQPRNWDARVKKISGEVRVLVSLGGKWEALEGERPISGPCWIKTADSVAEIYLDDKGVISVGRNTELEVSSLARSESVFTLRFGSVAAKLLKFMEEKLKMQVRTPSAMCNVRGTEFAVEYSSLLKNTGVAVFDEGSVTVDILGPKGGVMDEYLLEKNTELSFSPGQNRFRPEPLSRMARYRAQVIGMRKTLPSIGHTWKRAGGAGKETSREKALKPDTARRGKELAPGPVRKSRRAVRVKGMSGSDAGSVRKVR